MAGLEFCNYISYTVLDYCCIFSTTAITNFVCNQMKYRIKYVFMRSACEPSGSLKDVDIMLYF